MNCVRKHLSRHQGRAAGRALRAGARGHAADQRRAGRRARGHRQRPHGARRQHLRRCAGHPARATASSCRRPRAPGWRAAPSRRPSPAMPRFAGHEVHMIATPQQSLEAAAALARAAGIEAHILSDEIEGESREVGKVHAALARAVARRGAAVRAALRDPLAAARPRSRSKAQGRPRRPRHRVPARLRHRAAGRARRARAGGRHRRHRRHRGQRRRHRHARHAGARRGRWA